MDTEDNNVGESPGREDANFEKVSRLSGGNFADGMLYIMLELVILLNFCFLQLFPI